MAIGLRSRVRPIPDIVAFDAPYADIHGQGVVVGPRPHRDEPAMLEVRWLTGAYAGTTASYRREWLEEMPE